MGNRRQDDTKTNHEQRAECQEDAGEQAAGEPADNGQGGDRQEGEADEKLEHDYLVVQLTMPPSSVVQVVKRGGGGGGGSSGIGMRVLG
jgi:hypothetical protein